MSEYEIAQVQYFILEIYDLHGGSIEKDEWNGWAWIKYLELRKRCKGKIFLYYDWHQIYIKLTNVMDKLRKARNQKISLESRISLNETYGEGEQPTEGWIRKRPGDFVNSIALWDYIKRLGGIKYRVIKLMYYQESDKEIMEKLHICVEEYRKIKSELYFDFEEYLRWG